MTTATEHSKTDAKAGVQQWVQAYRRMVMIRLFEEQVNELYTRALMPGLAHLYVRQEAVAVGICEALRPNDYITSTHRPHLQAGVKCETCHGQVSQMEAMSEVTSVTTMCSCLSCHELNHAKTACDTCHKN